MVRRGIASIIAAIFLVLLVGIAMSASFSIYSNYRNYVMTQSEMEEWEVQKLRERLVLLNTSPGGGGGTERTVNISIVVSAEEFNVKSVNPSYPARLWKYDARFDKKVKLKMEPPKNSANLTMYFGKFDVYAGERWNLTLIIRYKISGHGNDVKVKVFDHSTNNWVDLVTLTPTNDKTVYVHIDTKYVYNNALKFGLESLGSHRVYLHLGIFRVDANLTYPNIHYGRFNATEGRTQRPKPLNLNDLALRDGRYFSDTRDNILYINITGIPTSVTYRDITGFITMGAKNRNWKVRVDVWNFDTNSWDLLNATIFEGKSGNKPGEEARIRIPLNSSYVSPAGKVVERITYDVASHSSGQFRIDEAVVDVTWLDSGGGGGGGGGGASSTVIVNDSPNDVIIRRIFYINGGDVYIYEPSPPIVLRPGQRLDLATYHTITNGMEVKVVTSYGNVFEFQF